MLLRGIMDVYAENPMYQWLYSPLLSLGRFFSYLTFYTVGRTPWMGDQPVERLPTHRRAQTQNKRTQTSMSQVGFEPTIPVCERAKTVHALERAATVIGYSENPTKPINPLREQMHSFGFRYNNYSALLGFRKFSIVRYSRK
jgi:hypothetical protein